MNQVRIRFLRPWQRYDRGDVATVDERFAEIWIRQRIAAPEPQEALVEAAVVEPADLRSADLTTRRRQRR